MPNVGLDTKIQEWRRPDRRCWKSYSRKLIDIVRRKMSSTMSRTELDSFKPAQSNCRSREVDSILRLPWTRLAGSNSPLSLLVSEAGISLRNCGSWPRAFYRIAECLKRSKQLWRRCSLGHMGSRQQDCATVSSLARLNMGAKPTPPPSDSVSPP